MGKSNGVVAEEGWGATPVARDLPGDEVHVWRACLDVSDAERERLLSFLSADERARAARFIRESVRRHFIAGRGFLRVTLARIVGRHPSEIGFRYGDHGKPMLLGAEDVYFNLSHSGAGAVLAVTRLRPLGIDLERLRPLANWEGIARRFFSEAEVADLSAVAEAERIAAFFNCWTRKEAFIKASGEGLSRPLDQFVVSLKPGDPARLLHVAGHPDEPAQWSFRPLSPWPDYVACLALAAHGWRLRCFE